MFNFTLLVVKIVFDDHADIDQRDANDGQQCGEQALVQMMFGFGHDSSAPPREKNSTMPAAASTPLSKNPEFRQ
jgi:hypothetical protein